MPIRAPAIVTLTICLFAPPWSASARPGKEQAPGPVAGALGGALATELAPTLPAAARPQLRADDAAREIQRRHGGRVLSVQPDGLGYRVKVLKNGEVRIYQINP